mmetsp:Transcript_6139/g.12764  ORF Transcript_6139/g.12764 Transcript_6139/m.12764 type:complete len:288 (-) Transcript_6139:338-1201(-)
MVWDTKHLSVSCGRYADTMLAKLHQSVSKADGVHTVKLADGFTSYDAGERCHEAGYDAYITGATYSGLADLGLAPTAAANTCYLMRSLLLLRLSGDDVRAEPGTVCHISFAPSTTTSDLIQLLAPLLPEGKERTSGGASMISIRWINDTSALAILHEEASVDELAILDLANAQPGMRAITYDDYLKKVERAAAAPAPGAPATAPTAAAAAEDAAPADTEAQTTGGASGAAPPPKMKASKGAAAAGKSTASGSKRAASGERGAPAVKAPKLADQERSGLTRRSARLAQ